LVFDAENRLRERVVASLAAIDPMWWSSRVPPEIRGKAQGRLEAESELVADTGSLHPISYLNIGELFDIIYMHWREVFEPVFDLEQKGLEGLVGRFELLRNRAAHSRPISAEQVQELRTTISRLRIETVPNA
jgi:hypothetical protein